MKRLAHPLMLLLLLAPNLFAAEDLTGKWGGTLIRTMDANPPRNDTALLVLNQAGTTLTGTAGPNENNQKAIAKGKVETVRNDGKDVTNVTLDVTNADDMTLHFVMTLVDGHLKGKAESEMDGHKMTAEFDLTLLKK